MSSSSGSASHRGPQSAHVTETIYRHVMVPAMRGGTTVMDGVINDGADDTYAGTQEASARQCGAVLTGRSAAGAYFVAWFMLRTISKGAER